MKFFEDKTNEYVKKFLESQTWEYFEWYNDGLEQVSIKDLENQSLVMVGSLLTRLHRHPITLGDYTYMLNDPNVADRIIRKSPKIPKPKPQDQRKFTVSGIKEIVS